IAFLGGRPAMISAATGAVALVIAPVAREHGMDMFIATVMLAGVFQILLAVAGVAKLIRFIPRSVMVGFVNALSILVFAAQVPHVIGVPWMVYPLLVLGIVVLFNYTGAFMYEGDSPLAEKRAAALALDPALLAKLL